MELRSYSHLHFIQAIKGNSVVKVLNVTRGRPALKFKEIKDIYGAANSEHHDSGSTFCPKQKFECSELDPASGRYETPSKLKADKNPTRKDPNSTESHCKVIGEGENDDLDYLGFGNMTLKQIKQISKSRKRKCASYIDLTKQVSRNQNYVKSEPEEDECDLEEPLSVWKSKISKNKNGKRKCEKDYMFTSIRRAISGVHTEQVSEDRKFLQPSHDMPTVDIKVEVNEPEYCNSHPIISFTVSSSSSSHDLGHGCKTLTDKVHVDARDNYLETNGSTCTRQETLCATNRQSFEYMEDANSKDAFDTYEQLDSCCVVITNKIHVAASDSIPGSDSSTSPGQKQIDLVEEAPCNYMECTDRETASDCTKQAYSCRLVNDKVHVDARDYGTEADESISPNENQFSIVNEASYTSTEHADPESVSDHNEQVSSCGMVKTNQLHMTAGQCLNESDTLTSNKQNQFCAIDEAACAHTVSADPKSDFSCGVSGWEIIKVESPDIISYESADLPETEFGNEEYVFDPLLDNISPEPIFMIKDDDDDDDDGSSIHDVSWSNCSDSRAQLVNMAIDNRLQDTKVGTCLYEGITEKNLPSHIESGSSNYVSGCDTWNFNPCMEPTGNLASVTDDSLSEKKQPILSACPCVPMNYSATMQCFDATAEILEATKSNDSCHSGMHHPPERLFSTRKAISPTSRERLLQAMNPSGSNDGKISGSRGKLCFAKQNENKIRRTDVNINTEEVHRRSKNDKKGSPPKGILKAPHLSNAVPCFTTGCTSTEKLQQSAIAFSQRQMRDIESLATKLTDELSLMRDIVNETLHSEACLATPLKHNVDKVTSAIKNASKAEQTAKRWLSIMARDCNRFCKIMKLTEIGPPKEIHKKEKKITFADEAGEDLCHVKVFKDDMATQPESGEIQEIPA